MKRSWYFGCIGILLLGLLIRQPLVIIAASLGLLVLLITDIWIKYCLSNLRIQRVLSEKRALFGEEITLALQVENAKILPLPWLEVEDSLPGSLRVRERALRRGASSHRGILENLFSLRWYERITTRYTLQCNQRGVHMFGPTRIRNGDIFGFTERQATLENRQYLIIYPLVVPLSSFSLPSRHPFGERRAQRRLLEDPSRIVGVRDYAYGDDIRRINWKATARALHLQSKIYEATTTYTLAIFLNITSQLDQYYSLHSELQELAICAAASVADWGLNEGYAVGLYSNCILHFPETGKQSLNTQQEGGLKTGGLAGLEQRSVKISPSSNEDQRGRIMEALARMQSFMGQTIEETIRHERPHLPTGSTVVVITSSISDPLLDTLSRLRQSGYAVTILLVSNQALNRSLAGIPTYHLGGEERWLELSAAFTRGTGEEKPDQPTQEKALASFQL